jgi:hypothetical protein
VVIYTPLLLSLVSIRLPPEHTASVFTTLGEDARGWIVLHLVRIVLTGFLGLAFHYLVDGLGTWTAAMARYSAGAWAVLAAALDGAHGLALGILVRNGSQIPPLHREILAQAAQKLYFDPLAGGAFSVLGVLVTLLWLMTSLGAAAALYQAGASPVPVTFLLAAAVLYGIPSVPLLGFMGMLCLFLGGFKIEWTRWRQTFPPPLPPPGGPACPSPAAQDPPA